ncbi:MAG: Pyrroline-5-carboxylate reductase [Chlamydiia bacterium]|nr:Pyrroline-5-carboxylate reductase [Chlamydiia bacterium]MCH9615753.1 Pyrroline-5-carboxylate reductase [Chlamydiia bacterium]MCH9628844.1 Pyrroline-5-carboxylate reductase [Chlamydiia bacterium]
MDIGIIGPGNMGMLFAKFLKEKGHRIILQGKDAEKTAEKARSIGAESTTLIEKVDVLIIAVKPKDIGTIQFGSATIIYSLVGKVMLEELEQTYPDQAVIRLCPNMPCLYGSGVVAIVNGTKVSDAEKKVTSELLTGMGLLVTIPESMMNPLFVYAGSGPGFFALFLEAYIDAGVRVGLKPEQARELAVNVMAGTAVALEREKVFPEVLRRQVSSPGGCTIRGVEAMEEGGLRSSVIDGVSRAVESLSPDQ